MKKKILIVEAKMLLVKRSKTKIVKKIYHDTVRVVNLTLLSQTDKNNNNKIR